VNIFLGQVGNCVRARSTRFHSSACSQIADLESAIFRRLGKARQVHSQPFTFEIHSLAPVATRAALIDVGRDRLIPPFKKTLRGAVTPPYRGGRMFHPTCMRRRVA
jgi:hypothetical protein